MNQILGEAPRINLPGFDDLFASPAAAGDTGPPLRRVFVFLGLRSPFWPAESIDSATRDVPPVCDSRQRGRKSLRSGNFRFLLGFRALRRPTHRHGSSRLNDRRRQLRGNPPVYRRPVHAPWTRRGQCARPVRIIRHYGTGFCVLAKSLQGFAGDRARYAVLTVNFNRGLFTVRSLRILLRSTTSPTTAGRARHTDRSVRRAG